MHPLRKTPLRVHEFPLIRRELLQVVHLVAEPLLQVLHLRCRGRARGQRRVQDVNMGESTEGVDLSFPSPSVLKLPPPTPLLEEGDVNITFFKLGM